MEVFSWQIVIVTLTILRFVNFADHFLKTSPLSLYCLTGFEKFFFQAVAMFYGIFLLLSRRLDERERG